MPRGPDAGTTPTPEDSLALAQPPEDKGWKASPGRAGLDHAANNNGTTATNASGHQFSGGNAAANNNALPQAAARDRHGVKVMGGGRGLGFGRGRRGERALD